MTAMSPSLPASDRASLAGRFERFYDVHAGRVFSLALRLTGDRDRASEVMQDTFVRIWERFATLRDPDAAAAWVTRVTLSVAFNARRAQRRRLERVALAGDLALPPGERSDTAPSIDALAASPSPFTTPPPLRRIALDHAIAALPRRTREVFVLHDVEGMVTEEVAALLHMAPSTVRVQLARARRLLREALAA